LRGHGDKTITRRPNVGALNDYKDARKFLTEDFGYMCGYCGKNAYIMHEHFHIDHFVPKKLDPDRINDYYNLVLACPKCNLTKSDKWPTKDKDCPHDERIGFVDPATPEYDEHLERNEDGYIVGTTALGKQICNNLNFDARRTDLFWKIKKLYAVQDELENVREKLTKEELQYYMDTNKLLKKYIDEAFEMRE
jgi:uncharacterized protein (TIGR02646 family)